MINFIKEFKFTILTVLEQSKNHNILTTLNNEQEEIRVKYTKLFKA